MWPRYRWAHVPAHGARAWICRLQQLARPRQMAGTAQSPLADRSEEPPMHQSHFVVLNREDHQKEVPSSAAPVFDVLSCEIPDKLRSQICRQYPDDLLAVQLLVIAPIMVMIGIKQQKHSLSYSRSRLIELVKEHYCLLAYHPCEIVVQRSAFLTTVVRSLWAENIGLESRCGTIDRQAIERKQVADPCGHFCFLMTAGTGEEKDYWAVRLP
ncbi:hypothetical protein N7G274_009026 [Stereocaulon virgatum]|uniref:Uncharacterized protein n=1 Tax=Stereocaulon virgatum TaxID=373712 RepID=A0ABR3ZXM8_9LECA